MTDDENEKEDLDSFFDDDSSIEEELVRVAEKLETMHRGEERMETKFLNSSNKDSSGSLHGPTYNDGNHSELVSFEYPADSAASTAKGGKAKKHGSGTSPATRTKDAEMMKNENVPSFLSSDNIGIW